MKNEKKRVKLLICFWLHYVVFLFILKRTFFSAFCVFGSYFRTLAVTLVSDFLKLFFGGFSDQKATGNTDVGSVLLVWQGIFFPPIQLSPQTLLQCSYNPSVQSHASTSAHTLKIPDTGSHTTIWTHENAAYTCRNE